MGPTHRPSTGPPRKYATVPHKGGGRENLETALLSPYQPVFLQRGNGPVSGFADGPNFN
jgi:hypothetical protein